MCLGNITTIKKMGAEMICSLQRQICTDVFHIIIQKRKSGDNCMLCGAAQPSNTVIKCLLRQCGKKKTHRGLTLKKNEMEKLTACREKKILLSAPAVWLSELVHYRLFNSSTLHHVDNPDRFLSPSLTPDFHTTHPEQRQAKPEKAPQRKCATSLMQTFSN